MSTSGGTGGGGGGFTTGDYPAVFQSLQLSDALAFDSSTALNPLLTGATSQVGVFRFTLTSLPALIAASSSVITTDGPSGSVTGLDTTTDDLKLTGVIVVSDLTCTNIITVSAQTTVAQSGPGQSGSLDWTDATPTVIAGTDLAWDGTGAGVTTTAGGIFVVTFKFSSQWD